MPHTPPTPTHVLRADAAEDVPRYVLDALSDPELRRHRSCAAVVFARIYGQLRFDGPPACVKVGGTARSLRMGRAAVRSALKVLEAQRYIRLSHRDQRGRGHYWLFDKRAAPRTTDPTEP